VKLNGEVVVEDGVRVPGPVVVIVTVVALVKVFPLIIAGAVPHVLPVEVDSVSEGGVAQPHATFNVLPTVVQSEVVFLTVIKWLPSATPVKVRLAWKVPASSLYSRFAPRGLVTVRAAFPDPPEQSGLTEGAAGTAFTVAITAVLAAVVQPARVAST
jgi:hypothetical protein